MALDASVNVEPGSSPPALRYAALVQPPATSHEMPASWR